MTDPFAVFKLVNTVNPGAVLGLGVLEMVFKWGVVLFLVLYCLFAAVIVKQTDMMSKTLEDGANGFVKFLAVIHLVASLLLTVAVILVV